MKLTTFLAAVRRSLRDGRLCGDANCTVGHSLEVNDKLCGTIYYLTDDVHIRSVVNSVFDTTSVEETLAELKSINGGERPDVIELK
jgi:hypothetical protein